MENKLLIICYSFPPHPGIGGRRWAKFAKYLCYKNYEIDVYNAVNFHKNKSFWYNDVSNAKINIHSFKFQFQKIITNPNTILLKIARKLLIYISRFSKYSPDMITSYPNADFWNSVEKKIQQENIKKVIVTGDPYLFYQTAKLKEKNNFELTLDYRDLWNDHSFYYKNVNLTNKQKKHFEYCENYAVNHSDKIIFVDEGILNTIRKRIINKNVTLSVIHNGFDLEDISHISIHKQNHSAKKRLIFAGSISSDLNTILLQFIEAFDGLKQTNNELYNKIEIHIFGTIDITLINKIKKLNLENVIVNNIHYSKSDYYKLLTEYDAGITLISDEYKDSFTTKFTDYLHLGKYIIAIAPNGKFSEFVKTNNIGITFSANNKNFFSEMYSGIMNHKSASPDHLKAFELKNLTEQLITFINR